MNKKLLNHSILKSTQAKNVKSSLKFLRFSFSRFQRLLRAASFGGAAGGGAALEQARPKAELTKGSSTFFVNRQGLAISLDFRIKRFSVTQLMFLSYQNIFKCKRQDLCVQLLSTPFQTISCIYSATS